MSEQHVVPGWYADPSGRFEYRWWDGTSWTDQASTAGQVSHAPLVVTVDDDAAASAAHLEPKITTFNAKKVAARFQQDNRELRERLESLVSVVQEMGGLEAAEVALRTGQLRHQQAALVAELAATRAELDRLSELVVVNRERVDLESDFGLYDYEHPAEVSATLATDLAILRAEIKSSNKAGIATTAVEQFTFNNSAAKGRTFVGQMSKIMLRWYNAEAESAVTSVKAGNLESALKRLNRVQEQVKKQGEMIHLTITDRYHELRLREVELAARHRRAVAAEKEREREHRAQLREQRLVEAELAKEKERLAKERAHYENSIRRLHESGDDAGALDLEAKLAAIDEEIAQADYRAANIRAGYVYVISNVGAFGDHVVKIGMTRRLEPMDRIRELGDASVPFKFDVHALFFSHDAVSIEAMLHRTFAAERLNKINLRREFFRVTPDQVLDVLRAHDVSILEYRLDAEAEEYRASQAVLTAG